MTSAAISTAAIAINGCSPRSGPGFWRSGAILIDRLEPLQVSWGYHYDRAKADERDDDGSTPRLRALEFEGTRDPCAWLAVADAIDFQTGLGWDAVRGRIRELWRTACANDSTAWCGLRLTTPADPAVQRRNDRILVAARAWTTKGYAVGFGNGGSRP